MNQVYEKLEAENNKIASNQVEKSEDSLLQGKDSKDDYSEEEDDFMMIKAPIIQVIEDKTQFSVQKYIKGIDQQKSYKNAYMPNAVK